MSFLCHPVVRISSSQYLVCEARKHRTGYGLSPRSTASAAALVLALGARTATPEGQIVVHGAHSGSTLELQVKGKRLVVEGLMARAASARLPLHPLPDGRLLPAPRRRLDRRPDGPLGRSRQGPEQAPGPAHRLPRRRLRQVRRQRRAGHLLLRRRPPQPLRRRAPATTSASPATRTATASAAPATTTARPAPAATAAGAAPAATSAGWARGRTAATAKAATTGSTAARARTGSTAARVTTTATGCRAGDARKPARPARCAEPQGATTVSVAFIPSSSWPSRLHQRR